MLWTYIGVLHSIQFIYMFVFVLVLCHFSYSGFMKQLETGYTDVTNVVIFAQKFYISHTLRPEFTKQAWHKI